MEFYNRDIHNILPFNDANRIQQHFVNLLGRMLDGMLDSFDERFKYLVGPYLASPNYWPAPNWPALIWPRQKLRFGQLGPKFGQDLPI